MEPYFSIIIPLYNKEKHIKKTLNSVLNQNFSGFEIIIVNDGSTDASVKALETIIDSRILVYTTENKGVSHARNYGISKANSDCIVFLDADDYWEPFHLEDLKTLHQQFPNCGIYAKAYVKEKHGIRFESIFNGIPKQENWSGIIEDYFVNSTANSIASGSSIMIPKPVFNTVGVFNEAYDSGEDTDLWIRIALKHTVVFSKKVSVVHNMDAINKITNSKLSERKFFDLNVYESLCEGRPSLKKYLDLNRASMAIQYKIEGAKKLEKSTQIPIDFNNLTRFQKILLKTPRFMIKALLNFKNLLQKAHIDLRLFR